MSLLLILGRKFASEADHVPLFRHLGDKLSRPFVSSEELVTGDDHGELNAPASGMDEYQPFAWFKLRGVIQEIHSGIDRSHAPTPRNESPISLRKARVWGLQHSFALTQSKRGAA